MYIYIFSTVSDVQHKKRDLYRYNELDGLQTVYVRSGMSYTSESGFTPFQDKGKG